MEVDRAVAAGRQDHRVRGLCPDLTGHQIADDDSAADAVIDDQIKHLGASMQLHGAAGHLPLQCLGPGHL